MELNEIEALLKLANQSTNSKSEAVEKLHQLKFIQNRLLLGLQLFLRGSQEQAQFFGLSLIRECLQSSLLGPEEEDHRRVVRESIWPYLNAQGAEIPTYYVNNLLSIVALLIKWDYPNLWPSAFQELLLLSKRDGLRTNLFLITVMQEFEIEVVAFNDSRSKEEVARNTHIKDVMRSTGVTYALTEFLCEVIINILDNISQAVGLNEIRSMEDAVRKALLRLSELFSWIDASIVRQALPLVFKCSMMFGENFSVQVEALICLRELLKRGMDAKTRLGLLQDLQLIPFICSLPFCQQSSKAKMKSNISERDFETDLQCARVIDLIFTEFASWVSLHEDSILPLKASSPEGTFSSINHNDGMNSSSAKSSSPSTLELVLPYLQFIHNSLHSLMKVVVRVLLNCCVSVTLAVTTSLQRILMLMKLQGTRSVKFAGQYAALLSVKEFDYFNTSRYLSEIQHALLFQSFYPDDMDFSEVEDDEDLQSLIEEKREVRRLFISFAKQNGAEALTRIASLIASEGSPGLTAIQYEAIFRLLASSAEFLADQLSEFPAFMAYIMNLDRRIFDHIESKIAFVELLVKFQNLSSLNGRTALLQVILEGFSVSTLLANATSSRNSHSVYYTQEIQVKFSQSLLKLLEGIGNGASANSVKETMFLQAKDVLAGIVVQVMTSLTLNSEGFIPVLANVSPSGNRLKKKNLVDQTVFQIFEAISLIICERSQDDQGNETFRALSSQIDYFQRIVQFLFELSEQMLLRGQTLLEASSHVNQFNQEIFESQLIRILTAISCVFKHIPKPSFHNFPQAFQLISSLLQKLLENPHSQRAEGVRLKIITILHFYMTSVELGYYQSFLPHFGLMIRTVGSIREMESLTQLLIQLMSTHPKDVTRPLLLDCYEIVTQACLHFNSNFERLLMSQTLSFEHEISAVENDRGLTFRILLNFHQQIMATRLDELFLSSFGRSTPQDLSQLFILIPGIFNEMSPTSLKLQRSSCVPLKRLCCTLVNSFISNWLISPDSPQLVSESTRSIIGLLETFLHERWLPLLIVNLSPGFILRSSRSQQLQQLVKQSLAPSFPGGLLNCKDAATQPVIGEIATTFFFLFFRTEGALMEGAKPSDSFVVYITGLLQQVEWPPEYQQLFFNLLIVKGSSSSSHLTTYKENFLKFARSLPT